MESDQFQHISRMGTQRRSASSTGAFPLRLALATALFLCGLSVSPASPEAVDKEKATKVKAAYVINFCKFTYWPPAAFADNKAPLVIGILGNDPLESVLRKAVEGKSVKKRRVVVRTVPYPQGADQSLENSGLHKALAECHLVFVSASEKKRLPAILTALRDLHVLSMSDMFDFAERGGMVELSRQSTRIILEINLKAVKKTQLKISSKILKWAKLVGTKEDGK